MTRKPSADLWLPLLSNWPRKLTSLYSWLKLRLYMSSRAYVTESYYPSTATSYSRIEEDTSEGTAIILRGPITRTHDFTLETIELYCRLYPNAPIIVSTWEHEIEYLTARRVPDSVNVVLTPFERPRHGGTINLQILGNLRGIEYAKGLGCKKVIATRTDQRFYEPRLLSNLECLMQQHPYISSGGNDQQVNRIICTSTDSFMYRLYGVSDMFFFGSIEDIYNYWNTSTVSNAWCQAVLGPHLSYSQGLGSEATGRVTHRGYSYGRWSEIYLMTEFLQRNGVEINWTLAQYWNQLGSRFIIMDSAAKGFFWPKYTWEEKQWGSYLSNPTMKEISYLEWLSMTNGRLPKVRDEHICDSDLW